MKLSKLISIVVLLLSVPAAFSQQLPQFTQYMFNTISINPAYAGSRETLSVVGLHRSQWVGFDGGPQTQTLSVHTPMRNENMGLGISFINDKLGYENFSYLYADYSYTIKTSERTKLAFGIKAGMTHYFLDQDLLTDPTVLGDQFFNDVSNRWSPNVGAGIYMHAPRWYVGLSTPRILNNDYNKSRNGEIDYVAFERVSYYITGGYVFDLSENTKLKPSVLFKATNGAPLSFDVSANFLFYEKFWAGAAYRANEHAAAIGAIADFQISKQMRIGYAYEYPISDIAPYTSGTHEVLLMFEVFKSNRIKSPRYF